MLTDAKFEELRATHGEVRRVDFLTDDDQSVSVVLRKPVADMHDPRRDQFLGHMTKRFAIEQARGVVADPTRDGNAELLGCVVYPEDPMAVRAHLADYPGDVVELRAALMDLAGEVVEDKDLVTDQVRGEFHRRALGFRANGKPVIARPMSAAEYASFVSKNGGRPWPFKAEALTWVAWSCVQERPRVDEADKTATKHKPEFEQLLGEVPLLGVVVGAHLVGKTQSRVVDREKK